MVTLGLVLNHHGRPLGDPAAELDQDTVERIAGALLAGLGTLARRTLFRHIAKIVDADVCPVLVGLIGPATSGESGKFCGAWPLLLPLAPYAEAVMSREADHAD